MSALAEALLVSSTLVVPCAVFLIAEAVGDWRERRTWAR